MCVIVRVWLIGMSLCAASGEIVLVVKPSLPARNQSLALRDHFFSECELLAIKNERISHLLELIFCLSALILCLLNPCQHFHRLVSVKCLKLFICLSWCLAQILRALVLIEFIDISLKNGCCVLEGLESDENLGLDLDSLLVVLLVPNLLVLVKLVDLPIEVSRGQPLAGLWDHIVIENVLFAHLLRLVCD